MTAPLPIRLGINIDHVATLRNARGGTHPDPWRAAVVAIEAGATERQPVEDKFYGDRSGSFEDPFGHRWHVASHVEDIPPEEMSKRAAEATAAG